MLRPGDIVWNTAVGDKGNVGRLVWDGSYLIVSPPCCRRYMRFLTADGAPRRSWTTRARIQATFRGTCRCFHQVIRTMGSSNPICHIDISPHNLHRLASMIPLVYPLYVLNSVVCRIRFVASCSLLCGLSKAQMVAQYPLPVFCACYPVYRSLLTVRTIGFVMQHTGRTQSCYLVALLLLGMCSLQQNQCNKKTGFIFVDFEPWQ